MKSVKILLRCGKLSFIVLMGVMNASAMETTVSNVTQLVDALQTHTSLNDRIWLERGVYDLTGVQMENDSTYGATHLVYASTWISGKGATPEDTVLLGDGTKRVLRCTANAGYQGSSGCRVSNLTISNGYAKAVSGVQYSGYGGGLCGIPIVTNCVITCCKADSGGGGARGGYIRSSKLLKNWTGGRGGGALKAGEIFSCEVRGNEATGNGGGISGADTSDVGPTGAIAGSTIADNVSSGQGGGVFWVSNIADTWICGNQAQGGSGGAFTWSGTMTECFVCSNRSYNASATSRAGGIENYTVTGGKIFANYVRGSGGGAYGGKLTGVEVFDNYATGEGGGVNSSTCTDCTIRDNFGGMNGSGGHQVGYNAAYSRLVRCDVSGTSLAGGSAVDSYIHDIGNEKKISGNPWMADAGMTNASIWTGIPVATNCVFYNNKTIGYSSTMFVGDSSASRGVTLVNCTIVSNKWGKTFNYTSSASGVAHIKNCVFYGNQGYDTTSFRDLHSWENTPTSGIRFENCAYGTSSGKFATIGDYADGPMYKFGAGGFASVPGFTGDEHHPYSLSRRSALRKIGLVEGWMSDGKDIVGNDRLRDGFCDIGAYQCWLPAPGAVLLLK